MGGRRRRRKPSAKRRDVLGWTMIAAGSALSVCCAIFVFGRIRAFFAEEDESAEILTTGYCNCGECCGWEPDAEGNPVYNYGPMKGRPKVVGRTSTGKTARHGTIAADPGRFKMGTRLYVPGYGLGRVEDIGGAIKGDHVDLWFPTHQEARAWGVRRLPVRVIRE